MAPRTPAERNTVGHETEIMIIVRQSESKSENEDLMRSRLKMPYVVLLFCSIDAYSNAALMSSAIILLLDFSIR